jgi:transcriptional regulator with XRE-family HTH domain
MLKKLLPVFKNKAFRDAYLFDAMAYKLGRQIAINRKARGMSVKKLASLAGIKMTELKKLEKGCIEGSKLQALTGIAKAFDCALSVHFERAHPACLRSPHFDEESALIEPGL